jgi:hypothetical protein
MYTVPSPPKPPPRAWKMPDIEHCPCCSASTERYAKPKCVQVHDGGAQLMSSMLFWVCDCCGCEWLHGQFEKAKTEPGIYFKSIHAGGKMTIDGRTFAVTEVSAPIPNPLNKFTIEITEKTTTQKGGNQA